MLLNDGKLTFSTLLFFTFTNADPYSLAVVVDTSMRSIAEVVDPIQDCLSLLDTLRLVLVDLEASVSFLDFFSIYGLRTLRISFFFGVLPSMIKLFFWDKPFRVKEPMFRIEGMRDSSTLVTVVPSDGLSISPATTSRFLVLTNLLQKRC